MKLDHIKRSVPLAMLLVLMSPLGCIRDHSYRSSLPVVSVPSRPEEPSSPNAHPPGTLPTAYARLKRGTVCDGSKDDAPARSDPPVQISVLQPCLAFLEFNDRGQYAVGNRSQLDGVKRLIRDAKTVDPATVVLVFVHGWKNNASPGNEDPAHPDKLAIPENADVQGFEEAINELHHTRFAGHPIVGIFVAWRGDTISHYWPVARQMSVYRREEVARHKVGVNFLGSLKEIITEARSSQPTNDSSRTTLILIGHSFGAIVLETAVTAIMQEELSPGNHHETSLEAPADLVIYVNSANAGTASKRVLDLLATSGVTYSDQIGKSRPLFLSVSSSADFATRVIFQGAHSVSPIPVEFRRPISIGTSVGPQPNVMQCTDGTGRSTRQDSSRSERDYWRVTAPHTDLMQSHQLRERCLTTHLAPGATEADCPVLGAGAFSMFLATDGRCFQIEQKQLPSGAIACNQTPYWVIEVDKTILPDHGTIFTLDMIRFLGRFLPPPGDTPTLRRNGSSPQT